MNECLVAAGPVFIAYTSNAASSNSRQLVRAQPTYVFGSASDYRLSARFPYPMNSIVTKLWNAAQHMIDGVIGRLPELVVALVIFFAFYILSGFVSRGIRRAVIERRQNLAVLFGRLASGATVALGLVVALSIVAPSFQAADVIKILSIGGAPLALLSRISCRTFSPAFFCCGPNPFAWATRSRSIPTRDEWKRFRP